jgi:hypothetical protein
VINRSAFCRGVPYFLRYDIRIFTGNEKKYLLPCPDPFSSIIGLLGSGSLETVYAVYAGH